MKLACLVFLLMVCHIANGQEKFPSKSKVKKVIDITIKQGKRSSCMNGLCGEWWIANKDSSYYTNDTLNLYNSSNISNISKEFCTPIIWTFFKENNFSISKGEMCKEPTTQTVKRISPFKYGINSKNSNTYITVCTNQGFSETYKAIGLESTVGDLLGEKSFVLTLVRQAK